MLAGVSAPRSLREETVACQAQRNPPRGLCRMGRKERPRACKACHAAAPERRVYSTVYGCFVRHLCALHG
jgi:hypothetical protein